MKITDLTTYLVTGSVTGIGPLTWVFIRLDTDEGISGWGEAGVRSDGVAPGVRLVLDGLKDELIGEPATDIERLWHKIYHRYTYFGSRGFGTNVVAAIDIALWDINGKATGRPIYDLLGGRFRDHIPTYVNVWFQDSWFRDGTATPEKYAEAAKQNILGYGYSACKLDPFLEMRAYHHKRHMGQISQAGEQQGYDIVAAVREVVGPAHEILIDAHGHYNVPTAIRLANHLFEQYNIGWFEEPVLPESNEGLRNVREHTAAPICVGERLHTRYDFVPIFQYRLADYIMPDTVWTDGISEMKKIATMAEAYDIPVSPHVVPGGPLELIAAAHVVATLPNFYRLEHAFHQIKSHNEMLTEPYTIENGDFILNGKPGLGYDLNEEWLAVHAVQG
ncbi:mandelate racemase/muconate lactonizing enzyme family protein [Chloroflexi bacterium TSY]|nr:mandelate racemase/muconate lactonizing enzyme family protein [Chloroflexi bacterium TSY]